MSGLSLSKIRKYGVRGTYQASRNRWIPLDPNSFGLPAGTSCPGRTEFCTSCYAGNSEQSAGVAELVHRNYAALLEAGTVDAMAELLAEMIDRYRRHVTKARIARTDWVFRIHWDGDFYSTDYARAWAQVIAANSDIGFWAYTRSFTPQVNVVPILDGIDNMVLYLSVDEHNAAMARHVLAAHPQVLAAYCAVDYASARALADTGRRPPIVCPENAGRMALMDQGRGACVECEVCTTGRRDILFSTSHVEHQGQAVAIRPRLTGDHRQPVISICARLGCTNEIVHQHRPGRPRKFCSDSCRIAAHSPTRRSA